MNEEWKVEFKPTAFKELKKLDRKIQNKIFQFLDRLIQNYDTPRFVGNALQGKYKGLWRYRAGDYRIICEIQDLRLIILVLNVAHRKEVYTSNLIPFPKHSHWL